MKKPLCSILLPTWRRLDRLKKTIKSIVDSAENKTCFEMLIRVQQDDPETMAAIPQLIHAAPVVRMVVGLPLRGYTDLATFYDDLADIAHGEWIWVMNDDVLVEGSGWDAILSKEEKNAIIMPEIHKLGFSTYIDDGANPFMFVPNKSWKQYGTDRFKNPFDHELWALLRNNGWPTRFMKGIGAWHDRDSDEELKRQRADSQPLPNYLNDQQEAPHG